MNEASQKSVGLIDQALSQLNLKRQEHAALQQAITHLAQCAEKAEVLEEEVADLKERLSQPVEG